MLLSTIKPLYSRLLLNGFIEGLELELVEETLEALWDVRRLF